VLAVRSRWRRNPPESPPLAVLGVWLTASGIGAVLTSIPLVGLGATSVPLKVSGGPSGVESHGDVLIVSELEWWRGEITHSTPRATLGGSAATSQLARTQAAATPKCGAWVVGQAPDGH
jgi:hypothetical protein